MALFSYWPQPNLWLAGLTDMKVAVASVKKRTCRWKSLTTHYISELALDYHHCEAGRGDEPGDFADQDIVLIVFISFRALVL